MSDSIAKKLPQYYFEDKVTWEISLALTSAVADKFDEWLGLLEQYRSRYLEPDTAQEEWLDYLAQQAAWGNIWDTGWTVEQKRDLLKKSDWIWRNRGNRKVAAELFKIFGLKAQLQPSTGFILNETEFPGALGSDPFDWIIKIDPSYSETSKEYILIKKITENFLPCWINLQLQT